MNKNDIIFLPGSTGLIGSSIYRLLKKNGYSNILTPSHKELDLTDQLKVELFFKNNMPKYVILAAGKVGGLSDNINYPMEYIFRNISIQLNVLKAAHQTNVDKLIYFGSSCMYPKQCSQPMAEELLLSSKPEITSMSYAIAKIAGLQMCMSINQQTKKNNFIPIIPNSVYGPNDNFDPDTAHVISALINKIHNAHINKRENIVLWGTGTPRREFIYSRDVADACLFLLENNISKIEMPLNIGTGKDYAINDLSKKIASIVGYKGKIGWDLTKPDGAPIKLLDSTRMINLGWTPKTEIDEGLKRTYEWYIQKLRYDTKNYDSIEPIVN